MIRRLLIFSLILNASFLNAKTVYITVGLCGKLFDINDSYINGDDQEQPRYQLKCALEQHGFTVKQADSIEDLEDVQCIICQEVVPEQLHTLQQYQKERCILLLWEPPSVLPRNYNPLYHSFFSKVLTWHDQLVDNQLYIKLHYPAMNPIITDIVPFEDKKLCTMISCNKGSSHPNELYSARRDTILFFETVAGNDFDLYGRGWSGHLKNYRGSIARKVDILKQYKFCICYENIQGVPGYVTEKIFDCFRAGCIPIYWGAPNITEYIPANCFIDRAQFHSHEELYEYIKNISKEEYENYIRNIQNFLISKQAHAYSIDNFINTVLDLVLAIPRD